MTRRCIALVGFLIISANAQDTAITRSASDCIVEMDLPRFGPGARAAGPAKDIRARLTLRDKGKLAGIEFQNGSDLHHKELEMYLRASRFSDVCAGRTLELIFSFEISGAALNYPFTWSKFIGPNHFVIATRPLIPIAH